MKEDKTNLHLDNEKYYRTLIETSSDAIVLMDPSGKVLYQTPSTEKILGYTLSEMQRIDGIDLIHPDDRLMDNHVFRELVNNPNCVVNRTHRVKHKNGSYIYIEGTYRNLLHDDSVKAIVFNYKDITEKVLAEIKLKRYNRDLTLLTKINDVILRTKNEIQLYKEVCECLVESGEYRLAWICHRPDESDADQTLVPIAASGEVNYLKNLKIDLDNPELSSGPTGLSLKTGKTVFINDTANEKIYHPWLEGATRHGLRSSISLYLLFDHNKSGVLNIYSGRIDAFDEREVLILERLATNLSIAIKNIRIRNELQESESRFRSAFEDSAIGMSIVSLEGRWLKVNRSLYEMLGLSEKELLSLTFQQITHPDDLGKDLEFLQRTLQGEIDTYRMEKRYFHKDGSIIWINLNVSMVRDYNKQPLYFVSQIENITEKVESQHNFRNLVESFIVGIFIVQNDKLVYVNPRVIEETGYSEQELLNVPFDKFIYNDDLESVQELVNKILVEGAETVRNEVRIQRKDGNILWYEILSNRIFYKGAPALIGTMVNISESKAMYDELRRSEANLKSIFDTTDISYLLIDTRYNIVALNQNMKNVYAEVTGLHLREGDNLKELLLPDKIMMVLEIYNRVIQNGRSEDYETSYITSGKTRHFLANVKPVYDDKIIIGLCISSMDITERKNALKQLQKLNENLEKKAKELAISNAELEEFAYVASHDLQEPLRMVNTFLTLLKNKYSNLLDDKAKQYIYFATDGAKRMRQLILQLLEYSRVGRTEDNMEEVDFNSLLNEVLVLLRRNVKETKAEIRFEHFPVIRTYKTPIKHVFQNLIGNALKYHKPGIPPVIEIYCADKGHFWEFTVKDNGIGIDSEYFDQIFIIFKRLHGREQYPGTGMGLAITKKILLHLGGKIWVRSKEGEGATFYFTVPKHEK